ncbi:MAG: efflux RND transporter permease subunit [Chloroflexota bacterium]
MNLTRTAVFHPVIALTVAIAIVLGGIVSYTALGLEQTPQLNVPVVTVQVTVPGASPRTIEEQVTRRIEDAVAGLGNIKTLSSTSRTGLATITIEFREGIDVDVAVNDVQQRVSAIRRDLPDEAEEPSFLKLDLNDTPVLYLAVTGQEGVNETDLYRVADDLVRPRLETADGVGRVVVVGGSEPEVQVDLLPDKLRAYGLTIDDVSAAVRTQFISTSGGDVKNGGGDSSQRASIRIDSRGGDQATSAGQSAAASAQQSLERLGSMPVMSADGFKTELRNVANIHLGGVEPTEVVRLNGKPAVGLQVYKQSSANIVKTVDTLLPLSEQVRGQLPDGYSLKTAIDRSTGVRKTVGGVEEELTLAAIITGLVLFFFLHSLRATSIVLIAIPTSLLIALVVMYLTGLTLNTMTLVGLTTAIGILVDDSIVVLENIFTHLGKGKDPKTAAVDGRSEIGMAAIAITMVDVAVWGPILVITGLVGAFLRNFALVIVAATLASLLVSFTLTPLIASRWLSGGTRGEGRGASHDPHSPLDPRPSILARIASFWEPAYRLLARGYAHLLSWSLRHRPVVMVVAVAFFLLNAVILPRLGTEFAPENNDETISVVGELPPGAGLEAADRAAKRWEQALANQTYFPEVHRVYTLVGRGDGDADREPRYITLTLDVGGGKSRVRTSKEIARAVADVGEIVNPDLQTRIGGSSPAGGGQPVQVRVFGSDLTQLAAVSEQARTTMAGLPEVADVTNSMATAPEVTLIPDPSRMMDLGLTTQSVGNAVRAAYQGVVVGRYAEPSGTERDVRVRLPDALRHNTSAIASLPLVQRGNQLVTVGQVTTTQTEQSPTRIQRVNRQRIALIGADTQDVPLGTSIAATQKAMNGLSLPSGNRWEFAGQAADQADSFRQLSLGLLASVILMYMVLSILYENWLQPALILSALPLATVGAFAGLFIFHLNLGIVAFIGLIGLFGMVGKNAILLVDRANELRKEGMDRITALEQAGESRLRPILMTSIVLILSMLPVALKLGEGGEVRAPIGAVLVGGMATSTILALLYVPVAYTYFDSLGQLLGRLVSFRLRLPSWARRSSEPRPSRDRTRPERIPLPVAGGAPTDVELAELAATTPHQSVRESRHARRARLEAYHQRRTLLDGNNVNSDL